MDILIVQKVGTSNKSSNRRHLCLSLEDLKKLCAIPDSDLKIILAESYNKNMTDEDIHIITGKTLQAIERVRKFPKVSKNKVRSQSVAIDSSKEFDPSDELNKLASSKESWHKVIALYWVIKDLNIVNQQSYKMLFSPVNIKFARELIKTYDIKTIERAMHITKDTALQKGFTWDLKTVLPFANKLANT